MDRLSAYHAKEIGLVFIDPSIANTLETHFAEDLVQASEITIDVWSSRPLFEKVRDWLTYEVVTSVLSVRHSFQHWREYKRQKRRAKNIL